MLLNTYLLFFFFFFFESGSLLLAAPESRQEYDHRLGFGIFLGWTNVVKIRGDWRKIICASLWFFIDTKLHKQQRLKPDEFPLSHVITHYTTLLRFATPTLCTQTTWAVYTYKTEPRLALCGTTGVALKSESLLICDLWMHPRVTQVQGITV